MGIDAEMFVRNRGPVTDMHLRSATHKLFCLFGPEELNTYHDSGFLERVPIWEQDGPDIIPAPGETFVRVFLWTRYYGKGYERGDFRLIHDLAEALERLFPDGAVWYGGDSSGVCAERFGPAERYALREHWLKVAHEPYQRHANPYIPNDQVVPDCLLCVMPMYRYGWGGNYAAFTCECGERVIRRDGNEERTTYWQRKEQERKGSA